MASSPKCLGCIVEYLDQGRFRSGLVVRQRDRYLTVLDGSHREKLVARDLVMVRHPAHVEASNLSEALEALESERAELASELDLQLLWEVVQEQGRSFAADELAELFFGRRSAITTSVMLEALLVDRLYFVRRHMEFVPRTSEQVERLRVQAEKIRMRSEEYRGTLRLLRQILHGDGALGAQETTTLVTKLRPYLENPFARSRELTTLLEQAAPDVEPAEAAFEILDRLGEAPQAPRFALIAGLNREFPPAVMAEAESTSAPERDVRDGGFTITIDDQETVELDDALSCEMLADGAIRVRVHIALAADFVTKGGAMDREAALRATTVYLPETTVRMLPDPISCHAASLIAGEERRVLTTEVRLSAQGEILEASIYPARSKIWERLDYEQADRILVAPATQGPLADSLTRLNALAVQLRERRRRAGAQLFQHREVKVKVSGDEIDVRVLDAASPSRILVGEFMVLSNFVAAQYAASNRIPIIYRVQPHATHEFVAQRARLSLYPEYHAGVGLDYYAQFSSPIRRYADLVLQRQLIGSLSRPGTSVYTLEELLNVLASAENAEAERRELERRAKQYWILHYLQRHKTDAELTAISLRDGAGAELVDYGVRGKVHGAPPLPNQTPIIVRISRLDPLRGWLSLDYLRPLQEAVEGAS